MPSKPGFVRNTYCICGQDAEMRTDKNGAPFVRCDFCGLKIFLRGFTHVAYWAYLDIEAYVKTNQQAHMTRARGRAKVARDQTRDKKLQPKAKPRSRAKKKSVKSS